MMNRFNSGVSAKIVLDHHLSREQKRLMIRITYKRKSAYYPVEGNLAITQEEFENPTEENTFFAMAYASSALKITNKIISECDDDFSFEDFADKYYHYVFGRPKTKAPTSRICNLSIREVFLMFFNENNVEESTKSNYRICLSWIKRFRGDEIKVSKIDEDFVTQWMTFVKSTFKSEKGRPMSINTFGMYIGGFKAVWNYARLKAKKNGEELIDLAPVLKRPASPRQNTSVSIPALIKFLSTKPIDAEEKFGRDFFLLSILLSGANLGDIFSLKNSNMNPL